MIAIRVIASIIDENRVPPLPSVNDIGAMWQPSMEQWATSIKVTLKKTLTRVIDRWVTLSVETLLSADDEEDEAAATLLEKSKSSIIRLAKGTFSTTPLPERPTAEELADSATVKPACMEGVELSSIREELTKVIKKAAGGGGPRRPKKSKTVPREDESAADEDTVATLVDRVACKVEALVKERNILLCLSSEESTDGLALHAFTRRGKESRYEESIALFDRAKRETGRMEMEEKVRRVEKKKRNRKMGKREEREQGIGGGQAKGDQGVLGVSWLAFT